MKKICFVLTAEFAVKAFMLKHIKVLSEHFEITVIVNTDNPNLLSQLGLNAKLIPLNVSRDINPISDFLCLIKLIKIFTTYRFDVIHSVTPKAGLLAMLAAWLVRIKKRVHTFQGEVWITKKGILRWLLINLDKLVALIATHITVVSQSERAFLIEQNIIDAKKSIVFGHGSISGVDTDRFKVNFIKRQDIRNKLTISEDAILLLYIGRLNRDKGILDLVNAFVGLKKNDTHLLIIGPDEHNLTAEILQAGHLKKDFLHIHPETNWPQDYMAAADVLCLPSYREGFGVVIIEAAACGIPSLSSRIYGITDAVIENETGLLHEAKNIDDIKSKLDLLSESSHLRQRLGENAYHRVKKSFDSKLITNAWYNFYKNILSNYD